jgi:hypothetical protein
MALAFESGGDRQQAIASAEAALAVREQIADPKAEQVRKQLIEWKGAE